MLVLPLLWFSESSSSTRNSGVIYTAPIAESLTVFNETEFTWYGDLIVNETDAYIIENCNFTVADGFIFVHGELQISNSSICIRKPTPTKYIYVYGSLRLFNSTILGTGMVISEGPDNALIWIENSTLPSWRFVDGISTSTAENDISIFGSELEFVYISGNGGAFYVLKIQNCRMKELRISLPGQGNDFLLSADVQNSTIDRFVMEPGDYNVTFQDLYKGWIQDWKYLKPNANLTISTSNVNQWSITICNFQTLTVANSNIDLDLTFVEKEDAELTLRPGFVEYEKLSGSDFLDITVINSTINAWACSVLFSNITLSGSECEVWISYEGVVTLLNSTISMLSAYWGNYYNGSLLVQDCNVRTFQFGYRTGEMDFTLYSGFFDNSSFFNAPRNTNITIYRTTVEYWNLLASGNAVLNIRNSTFPAPETIDPYRERYSRPGVFCSGTARMNVYDSELAFGMAYGNASLSLVNCTLQMLLAYDYANVTSIDSTIRTLVRDPPTLTLINSELAADILLPFEVAEDRLSIAAEDDFQVPVPADIENVTKYLEVNSTYNDIVDSEIRMFYNQTEVENAGRNENGLHMFFLNESRIWQLCSLQGVNAANDYVWANISRFGCFVVGFDSPTHDISLSESVNYRENIGQGQSEKINTTVTNRGDFSEEFNVTLHVNGTSVETKSLSLPSYTSTTVTFVLNTSTMGMGRYNVTIYVASVENETMVSDNADYRNLTVTVPGDVKGDFIVDIYDAILLSSAFNTIPDHSNWNPNADINGDNIVDIFDAIILANHFNQHYP